MTDLWGEIPLGKTQNEESKAIEILREQARLLEKKTDSKIKATFSKLKYKIDTDRIGQVIRAINGTGVEIMDSELEGKEDINEIYNFTKYKFEIYNSTYRFRVFILNFRSVFPIEIEVDEGIRDELKISSKESINNDEELKELVSNIFSSVKLKKIIGKMYSI